jgi:D-arabinose 1-dehydrogenase-like Zn-dependent alcohol dehydrogenase
VLPARNVVPIPDALGPVAATVVPDAVATPVHVCGRRARVRPGDRVAIIGAGGGVGIHMVQVARLMGSEVVGIDLADDKLALIEHHGGHGVHGDDLDALDPRLWSEGPPTVVIDLVGTDRTLAWGARALDVGGRMVVVTTVRDGRLEVLPRDLVYREFAVMGSRYARRSEPAMAARLVASGRIDPVVSAVVAPDGIPGIHERLRAGTLLGRGAVTWDGVHRV